MSISHGSSKFSDLLISTNSLFEEPQAESKQNHLVKRAESISSASNVETTEMASLLESLTGRGNLSNEAKNRQMTELTKMLFKKKERCDKYNKEEYFEINSSCKDEQESRLYTASLRGSNSPKNKEDMTNETQDLRYKNSILKKEIEEYKKIVDILNLEVMRTTKREKKTFPKGFRELIFLANDVHISLSSFFRRLGDISGFDGSSELCIWLKIITNTEMSSICPTKLGELKKCCLNIKESLRAAVKEMKNMREFKRTSELREIEKATALLMQGKDSDINSNLNVKKILRKKDETIAGMTSQLEELVKFKNKSNYISTENEVISKKLEELSNKNDVLESQIETIKGIVKLKDSLLLQYEKELENCKNSMSKKVNYTTECSVQVDQVQYIAKQEGPNEKDYLLSKITELVSILFKKEEIIEKLQKNKPTTKDKINDLYTKITEYNPTESDEEGSCNSRVEEIEANFQTIMEDSRNTDLFNKNHNSNPQLLDMATVNTTLSNFKKMKSLDGNTYDKITDICKQNGQLSIKVELLTHELEEKSYQVQNLQEALDRARLSCSNPESSQKLQIGDSDKELLIERYSAQISSLQGMVKSLKQENEELAYHLKDTRQENVTLEAKIDEIDCSRINNIHSLELQNKSFRGQLQESEDALERFRRRDVENKSEVGMLEEELQKLRHQNTRLTELVRSMNDDKEKSNSKIRTSENITKASCQDDNEIISLSESVNKSKDEIVSLNAKLQEEKESVKCLKLKILNLQEKLDSRVSKSFMRDVGIETQIVSDEIDLNGLNYTLQSAHSSRNLMQFNQDESSILSYQEYSSRFRVVDGISKNDHKELCSSSSQTDYVVNESSTQTTLDLNNLIRQYNDLVKFEEGQLLKRSNQSSFGIQTEQRTQKTIHSQTDLIVGVEKSNNTEIEGKENFNVRDPNIAYNQVQHVTPIKKKTTSEYHTIKWSAAYNDSIEMKENHPTPTKIMCATHKQIPLLPSDPNMATPSLPKAPLRSYTTILNIPRRSASRSLLPKRSPKPKKRELERASQEEQSPSFKSPKPAPSSPTPLSSFKQLALPLFSPSTSKDSSTWKKRKSIVSCVKEDSPESGSSWIKKPLNNSKF